MAAQENSIFVLPHFDYGQNVKNYFPKGNFQWELAQSRGTWIDLNYWYNIQKQTNEQTNKQKTKNKKQTYSVWQWQPKEFFDIAQ